MLNQVILSSIKYSKVNKEADKNDKAPASTRLSKLGSYEYLVISTFFHIYQHSRHVVHVDNTLETRVTILKLRTIICIIFINLCYFMSGINISQRIQSLAQDCKCSVCSFLTQFLFQILHFIRYIVGEFRSLWSERISNSHEHIKRNLSDSSIQPPNLLLDNNNNWIHLLGDYNSQPVKLLKDNNNNWCHRISHLS